VYSTPYSRHNTDKKMIEGHENKNIPVMQTTIEGAQKRIELLIDWATAVHNGKTEGMRRAAALEYIGVFLDSVEDEMAAITSSCNSLHDRYVAAVAEIDQLREENESLRKGNLNNLHAADDNR